MTVTFMVRCFIDEAQKSVAVSSQNTVGRCGFDHLLTK
jgi:hypothetical protein